MKKLCEKSVWFLLKYPKTTRIMLYILYPGYAKCFQQCLEILRNPTSLRHVQVILGFALTALEIIDY